MTAARLASIAPSQSTKKVSGLSATPSRDNSSYKTTLRMGAPPVERDVPSLTARTVETHRSFPAAARRGPRPTLRAMQQVLDVSNDVAAELAAIGDGVLDALRDRLRCTIRLRGNRLTIEGDDDRV